MAYGLNASRNAISRRLQKLLDGKRFQGVRIYDRIAFIDDQSVILADVRAPDTPEAGLLDWREFTAPGIYAASIVPRAEGESLRTAICASYIFKGAPGGLLVAWLSPHPVFSRIVSMSQTSDDRSCRLILEGDRPGSPASAPPFSGVRMESAAEPGNQPDLKSFLKDILSPADDRVTLRAPVSGTPFTVMMTVSAVSVYGHAAPWILPMVMAVLAALFLAGAAGIWRFSTRDAVLQARLEETAKREKAIAAINQDLLVEMDARRQVTAALRESERKYRAIFESFLDIYCRTDAEGRIAVISPSVHAECGWLPESLTGRPVSEFFADAAEWQEVVQELRLNAAVRDVELKLLTAHGEVIHVSMNARRVSDGDATRTGIECVLRNITRKKLDEQALRENRQRLDLAISGGDLGVWDWFVPTGRVVFSERWCAMLGFAPSEIEPHVDSWQERVHPEDLDAAIKAVEAHLEGRTHLYESEHRMRHKSGGWVWILDRGQVVERDANGKPLRMVGTHMNITRRKEAELALKEYQNNLENLIAERTHDLKTAQDQLINRAMEAGRSQLSAILLHNIGNALTPVGVTLSSLRENNPEQAIAFLDKCYGDIQGHLDTASEYLKADPRGREVFSFMGGLIAELKRFSARKHALEGKIETTVSYISDILTMHQAYAATEKEMRSLSDLNVLIQDAVRMQAGALEKRRIRVAMDLPPVSPRLLIDRNRLMQVMVNLIKNAYESMDMASPPPAEKVLSVRTWSERGQACFRISDTGAGIAPGESAGLFEFGRSGKGSSGFGLYYCKMFAEANQGKLSLESDGLGKGAQATVILPAAPEKRPESGLSPDPLETDQNDSHHPAEQSKGYFGARPAG